MRTENIVLDDLWGQQVNAVNVQIPVTAIVSKQLSRLQQTLLTSDSLFKIPEHALHISVLWIIAARTDYGIERQKLWASI